MGTTLLLYLGNWSWRSAAALRGVDRDAVTGTLFPLQRLRFVRHSLVISPNCASARRTERLLTRADHEVVIATLRTGSRSRCDGRRAQSKVRGIVEQIASAGSGINVPGHALRSTPPARVASAKAIPKVQSNVVPIQLTA